LFIETKKAPVSRAAADFLSRPEPETFQLPKIAAIRYKRAARNLIRSRQRQE
jgi:hypothetical protein